MIRRICTAAAMAALPLMCGLPSAHADVFFQGQTNATAVHVTITQQPASSIITASLLDDAVSYVSSDFDTGGSSEALGAPAFPGRLVVQGPQLLCSELFSCPAQPPAYPLLADASYPRRAHDTATVSGTPTGSGPFVVTPLTADATASATSNNSSTEAGHVTLLSGTPGVMDVGSSSATTATRVANGSLQISVSTSVHDIAIGALVHIDSVHAVDQLTVTPGHAPSAKPQITVSGVTVAGHAASIDDTGLHVDGTGGPGLTQRVAQQGISIRTVGAQHHETKNGSRSDATALAIDLSLPVSGLPYIPNPLPPLPPPFDQIPALPGVNANGDYIAHISLGAVGAAAGVGTEPNFDLGGTGPQPSRSGPTTGATNAGSTSASAPVGGNELMTQLAVPTQSPPSVAAPQSGALSGFVDLLSKGDMESLYLVMALGTTALFIGWRAAVAVRAGRTR